MLGELDFKVGDETFEHEPTDPLWVEKQLDRFLACSAHQWGDHFRVHAVPDVFRAIRTHAGLSQRELARQMALAIDDEGQRITDGTVGAITFRINQFEAGKQSLRGQDLDAAQTIFQNALCIDHAQVG
jgi:hypothetical protein